jgi:hypothetical protein
VLLKNEEFLHSVIVTIEMAITATASVNVTAMSCKHSIPFSLKREITLRRKE